MTNKFYKVFKPYKGYNITKTWMIDHKGEPVNIRYQITIGEDAICIFKTLYDARYFIKTVLF